MNDKLFSIIFKVNDSIPVAGGALGAFSQAQILTNFFPSWASISETLIITLIGAVGGYMIKLLLDILCRKIKKRFGI